MANTIDDKLLLTETLNATMRATKRKLLALLAFCTVFRNVALKGDDKMVIPYYPLAAVGTSQSRAANGSYKALATGTQTLSKSIEEWHNKVQALSFTSRERRRNPAFNPEMHGTLKGEALAYDVISHIFSVVGSGRFTGTTIAPVTAGNFDENEVGDLRQICAEEFWPEVGRALILNPAFGTSLLKQPQIIDASKRGDGGRSFRDGVIGNVLGFDVYETAGLQPNNTVAVAMTGEADTDLITAAGHGLLNKDRVILPTKTGGTGLTAATQEYFARDVDGDTFKLSLTPGGAVVDFTTDITAGTVRRFEDIQGMAILPSALLIGFAPVPPTDGIRKALVDYQQLTDEETGLVLEYKRLAYPDTDEEVQTIECNYGFDVGDESQLKIIRKPLA